MSLLFKYCLLCSSWRLTGGQVDGKHRRLSFGCRGGRAVHSLVSPQQVRCIIDATRLVDDDTGLVDDNTGPDDDVTGLVDNRRRARCTLRRGCHRRHPATSHALRYLRIVAYWSIGRLRCLSLFRCLNLFPCFAPFLCGRFDPCMATNDVVGGGIVAMPASPPPSWSRAFDPAACDAFAYSTFCTF